MGELGIILGDGTKNFKPANNITRAELASIVYNVIREKTNINPDDYMIKEFTDIVKEHWSYKPVTVLYNLGIVNGYGTGKFKPYNNITRAEISAVLTNLLEFFDIFPYNNGDIYDLTYTDVAEGYWAYRYISDLTQHGIIVGYTDKTFKPLSSVTKAESAVMISLL